MQRHNGWTSIALATALTACSSVDQTGSAGLAIEGSYELSFASVSGQQTAPPSLAEALRLDIRAAGGGYEALLTSRFASPSPSQVVLTADSLTLVDGVDVREGDITDGWASLVLDLDDDGQLTGSFEASGDQQIFHDDYFTGTDITGDGTLAADGASPETKILHLSAASGPEDAQLPWHQLGAWYASEGVAEQGLTDHLFVTGPTGSEPAAMTWTIAPYTEPEERWAGVTRAHGHLADWTALRRGGALAFSVDGDLTDPSGNQGGAWESSVQLFDVGEPAAAYEFDDGASSVNSWGEVQHLAPTAADHPDCEQGGCVQIGPFDTDICGADRIGLAAMLSAGASDSVRIRYRIVMQEDPSAIHSLPVAVSVELAGSDGAAETSTLQALAEDFAPDGASFATGWTDWDVNLPAAAATEVGLSLHAGSGAGLCGHPMEGMEVTMTVYVDRVTTD